MLMFRVSWAALLGIIDRRNFVYCHSMCMEANNPQDNQVC